jgi:hypothetical protein
MQSTILSHLRSLYPRGCSVYDLLLHSLQLSEAQRGQLDVIAKQIRDSKSKAKVTSAAFSRLSLSATQLKSLRDVQCHLHLLVQDDQILTIPPESVERKTNNRKKTIEDTTGEMTDRVRQDWPKMLRLMPLPDQEAITTHKFSELCLREFHHDEAFIMSCLDFLSSVELVQKDTNGFRASTWIRKEFVDDWMLFAKPLRPATVAPPSSILQLSNDAPSIRSR